MKKNKIQLELDKIEIPKELHSRAALGIAQAKTEMNNSNQENRIGMGKKKMTIRKKIMYTGTAAAVAFSLFIGSAFFSPSMAKVASNIPYFGIMFDNRNATQIIESVLLDEGYPINGIDGRPGETYSHIIYVGGNEEYYNEVKGEIEEMAGDILNRKGFDSYEIEVVRDKHNPPRIETAQEKRQRKLTETIDAYLKQKNFLVLSSFEDPTTEESDISVVIPTTESREEEIKKAVKDLIDSKNLDYDSVNIIKQEKSVSSEFGPLAQIMQSKSEFSLDEISFKDKTSSTPFQIIVRTPQESTDPNAKKHAEEIEKFINDFYNSKEVAPYIEDPRFSLNIYSKDNKRIN